MDTCNTIFNAMCCTTFNRLQILVTLSVNKLIVMHDTARIDCLRNNVASKIVAFTITSLTYTLELAPKHRTNIPMTDSRRNSGSKLIL